MDIAPRPYALLAELTYRCPLHCPYCSNPVQTPHGSGELDTEQWKGVIREAAPLGVLQIGFSGGEPLLRKDLEALVQLARGMGCYTNLITSGLGLSEERAHQLAQAGLDNIQLSFQAEEAGLADQIAGVRGGHLKKIQAAQIVKEAGIGLSLNVVLHRFNIERIEEIIDFAAQSGATRLELANTQYYGWAFRNRSRLIPTRSQADRATQVAMAARTRLKGAMELLYVLPDYFSGRPKPCMGGWGRRYLTVNPSGYVLPCPTAWEIPGLEFDTVREKSLSWIWKDSESFKRFRGVDWMPEPCRSCPQKEIDFGGCRCQAALLTGDAANTDPACKFSPRHDLVQEAAQSGPGTSVFEDLLFRDEPLQASKESLWRLL